MYKIILIFIFLATGASGSDEKEIYGLPSEASTISLISAASSLLYKDPIHQKEIFNELINREVETREALLKQAIFFKRKDESGQIIGSANNLRDSVLVSDLFGKEFQYEVLKSGFLNQYITIHDVDYIATFFEIFDVVSFNKEDSPTLLKALNEKNILSKKIQDRWSNLIDGTRKSKVRSISNILNLKLASAVKKEKSSVIEIISNEIKEEVKLQDIASKDRNNPIIWIVIGLLALVTSFIGITVFKKVNR